MCHLGYFVLDYALTDHSDSWSVQPCKNMNPIILMSFEKKCRQINEEMLKYAIRLRSY